MITSFSFKIFFYMSKFRSCAMISFNDFFYFINFVVLQQFIFYVLLNDCFVSTILFSIVVHAKNSRNISFRESLVNSKFKWFSSFCFFEYSIMFLMKSRSLFLYFNALLFILWINFIKILNLHSVNIFDDFDSKCVWIWQSILCNRAFIVTKAKDVLNT